MDGRGWTFTLPELNPIINPFVLNIGLDRNPPRILEFSPLEKAVLGDRRPVITVSYEDAETRVDTDSVRILLDNTDVTQLARITEKRATFQPSTDLEYGQHGVFIDLSKRGR
ncbi:MAG: hypothetical protein SV375_07920 [Thermodesulfobacteriota bacterium]|nr:hypothetical protein [Thermodesulfobacteriota bacterium]